MTKTPTLDFLKQQMTLQNDRFRKARAEMVALTLAMIVIDLREENITNARFLACELTDQDDSGSLTFFALQDVNGVEIDLDDGGDRYWDEIPLYNLDDSNFELWKGFLADPALKSSGVRTLDLVPIALALEAGTLI